MNCRDAEVLIHLERDGPLAAAQAAAIAEHVAECPACHRMRANLAAAIESWRASLKTAVTPDPEREWATLRRKIRSAGSEDGRAATGRHFKPWLALPLGAAAALAFALFVRQPTPVPAGKTIAQSGSVEVSAADGSVVFVDDRSGWVVVWEAEAASTTL